MQSDLPIPNLLVSVDPSQRSAGMAAIDMANGEIVEVIHLTNDAAGESLHKGGWARPACCMGRAVAFVAQQLSSLYSPVTIHTICELPANWFSEKAIASKDSEDIQKLYFSVGHLCGELSRIPVVKSIHLILPGLWKGQKPKRIMVKRAKRFIPTITNHDVAEALLLGKLAYEKREHGEPSTLRLPEPFVQVYGGEPHAPNKRSDNMGELHGMPNLGGVVIDYCVR